MHFVAFVGVCRLRDINQLATQGEEVSSELDSAGERRNLLRRLGTDALEGIALASDLLRIGLRSTHPHVRALCGNGAILVLVLVGAKEV